MADGLSGRLGGWLGSLTAGAEEKLVVAFLRGNLTAGLSLLPDLFPSAGTVYFTTSNFLLYISQCCYPTWQPDRWAQPAT